ncbi:MAG: I78 family peptidase inhibitor [Pararhodobacter sp.]
MKALYALGAVALLAACDPLPPVQSQRTPPPRPVAPEVTAPAVTPLPPVAAPSQPVPPRAPVPDLPPVASVPGDTCGSAGLQGFVGSVAPQPFPAPGPVRVYAEGDPVTMDHNPQRLNVVLDAENRQRVVSLSCG